MATTKQDTTSQRFCCNTCGAAVVIKLINADDLAYVCQNRRCQRSVSVDTPEALAILEILELAIMPVLPIDDTWSDRYDRWHAKQEATRLATEAITARVR